MKYDLLQYISLRGYYIYTSGDKAKPSSLKQLVQYSLEKLLSLVRDDLGIEGIIVSTGDKYSVFPSEAAELILNAGKEKRDSLH